MQSDFQIEIASQGWLLGEPGYDPLAQDLCTHGQIDLVIGGAVIAASVGDASYGISEAALALLRTLSADHSPRMRVADRLIPHGCGAILMMSCPSVAISRSHYRDEVVSFARKAKEPFAGVEKVFGDEFDQEQYASFWNEYDRLLTDAQA